MTVLGQDHFEHLILSNTSSQSTYQDRPLIKMFLLMMNSPFKYCVDVYSSIYNVQTNLVLQHQLSIRENVLFYETKHGVKFQKICQKLLSSLYGLENNYTGSDGKVCNIYLAIFALQTGKTQQPTWACVQQTILWESKHTDILSGQFEALQMTRLKLRDCVNIRSV